MSTIKATAGKDGIRSHGVDDRLYELASHLTERDRIICRLLHEHRVLTTRQVADVGFGSLRKTQQRLALLHALEVVDRFRLRSWSGRGPHHFTLGSAGAAVVAAERGVSVGELAWRRDSATALATNSQLDHLVGCNGFFTALIRSARHQREASLDEWWSARRCAGAWGEAVRPDAYAVWVEGDVRLPFCFEYDTGTETLGRLEAKLNGYARLSRAAGHPTWVLFSFPSVGREAHARRVLGHREVAVATSVITPGSSPDGPLWLAVRDNGYRKRLIDLGHPGSALQRDREGN